MSERDDIDLDAIRAQLIAERDEIMATSAGAAEARKPVTLDQQSVGRLSRMDALQVQAMAQAVEERRQTRLVRIGAALQRLDSGDYGFCSLCEEDIPAARLAIDPTTTRCVDCAGRSDAD